MDVVAFFIKKFQLSNWSPSYPTLITYIGSCDGPHWPDPVTAPMTTHSPTALQPHLT